MRIIIDTDDNKDVAEMKLENIIIEIRNLLNDKKLTWIEEYYNSNSIRREKTIFKKEIECTLIKDDTR